MENNERSITVGLLGANHEITQRIGEALGTPGQKTDLQFYNRLDTQIGIVFTGVAPIGYPDKIKSLVQTCAETDLHVMIIDADQGITPEIAEILVIMDIYARRFNSRYIAAIGGVNNKNEWQVAEIRKKLPKILQNTTLHDMEVISLKNRQDYNHFKQRLNEISISLCEKKTESEVPVKVLIDHAFPVKGVGTVALGLVKQGVLEAGKMYDLIPGQRKIILRSIQKFDRDFKTAFPGDRVGLALKGVNADLIDRNSIFCSLDSMDTSAELEIELTVSPFYKPQSPNNRISPTDSKTYQSIVDLGITPTRLIAGDEIVPGESGSLQVLFEKPLAHFPGKMQGLMVDFGPFKKQSRIVGYFELKL